MANKLTKKVKYKMGHLQVKMHLEILNDIRRVSSYIDIKAQSPLPQTLSILNLGKSGRKSATLPSENI